MLRPLREALALEVGVDQQPLAVHRGSPSPASLLPLYWWVVGRTPRGRLLWCVGIPFVAVFVSLAIGLASAPRDQTLAFIYFVALSFRQPLPRLRVLERDGRRVAPRTREAVLRLRGRGWQRRRDPRTQHSSTPWSTTSARRR
ncbi:MAG: hypothetical protein QM747_13535 [Nocardioides sp.]